MVANCRAWVLLNGEAALLAWRAHFSFSPQLTIQRHRIDSTITPAYLEPFHQQSIKMPESPPPERQSGKQLHDPPADPQISPAGMRQAHEEEDDGGVHPQLRVLAEQHGQVQLVHGS